MSKALDVFCFYFISKRNAFLRKCNVRKIPSDPIQYLSTSTYFPLDVHIQ